MLANEAHDLDDRVALHIERRCDRHGPGAIPQQRRQAVLSGVEEIDDLDIQAPPGQVGLEIRDGEVAQFHRVQPVVVARGLPQYRVQELDMV